MFQKEDKANDTNIYSPLTDIIKYLHHGLGVYKFMSVWVCVCPSLGPSTFIKVSMEKIDKNENFRSVKTPLETLTPVL